MLVYVQLHGGEEVNGGHYKGERVNSFCTAASERQISVPSREDSEMQPESSRINVHPLFMLFR